MCNYPQFSDILWSTIIIIIIMIIHFIIILQFWDTDYLKASIQFCS